MVKATKNKNSKTVIVEQIRGTIGRPKDQGATLVGLGLRGIGRVSELLDTTEVRGMMKKVSHLIKIVKE